MGRIVLITAAAVLGFFVLGAVLGFVVSLLKWLLPLGVIALAVAVVVRFLRDGGRLPGRGTR